MTTTRFLRFGEVTLDLEAHAVLRDARVFPLQEEYWNALVRLIEKAGKVVSKKELYDVLGTSTEGTLTKQIQRIREALGDTARPFRVIMSERGRGYKFVAVAAQQTASWASEEASHSREAEFSAAKPQLVRWGPSDDQNKPPGICVVSSPTSDVPWEKLEQELPTRLLNQLGRHIPSNCTVTLADWKGRRNGELP